MPPKTPLGLLKESHKYQWGKKLPNNVLTFNHWWLGNAGVAIMHAASLFSSTNHQLSLLLALSWYRLRFCLSSSLPGYLLSGTRPFIYIFYLLLLLLFTSNQWNGIRVKVPNQLLIFSLEKKIERKEDFMLSVWIQRLQRAKGSPSL